MSIIDIINNLFEYTITKNFYNNQNIINELTYIESDIITLIKNKKFNNEFNDNIDYIFLKIIDKNNDIFSELITEIKKEYNIYLNNLEKKHMELIKTTTYKIDTQ